MDELLDAVGAAQIIDCSPRYVRALADAGKVEARRVGKHMLVFDRASVERYAASTRHPGGRPRKTPTADAPS